MNRTMRLALCVLLAFTLLAGTALAGAAPRFEREADALAELGLFRGSGSGYQLTRECTRTEAAVMIVRMVGRESEAVRDNNKHPFKDVEGWASPYIGWMYKHGLATGVSDTEFGGAGFASAKQYCAFLLRTLGYVTGKTGDFLFEDTLDFAVIAGLITRDQKLDLQSRPFLRDDMVLLSYKCLSVQLKDSHVTLAEKLVTDGVFTMSQYLRAVSKTDGLTFELTENGHITASDGDELIFTSRNAYSKLFQADDFIIARSTNDSALYMIDKQNISESRFSPTMELDPITVSGNNLYLFRYSDESKASLLVFNGRELTELVAATNFVSQPIIGEDSITLVSVSSGNVCIDKAFTQTGKLSRIAVIDGNSAAVLPMKTDSVLVLIGAPNSTTTLVVSGSHVVGQYQSPAQNTLEQPPGIHGLIEYPDRTLVFSEQGLFSLSDGGASFNRIYDKPVISAAYKEGDYYVATGSTRYNEIGVVSGGNTYIPLLTGEPDHGISILSIEEVASDGIYFSNRKPGEKDSYHYKLSDGKISVVAYSPVNVGYIGARETGTEADAQKASEEQARINHLTSK